MRIMIEKNNEDYRIIYQDYLIGIKKIRSRLAIQRKNNNKKTKQTNLVSYIVKDIYIICWDCGFKNFKRNFRIERNDMNQKVVFCNECKSQIDYVGN